MPLMKTIDHFISKNEMIIKTNLSLIPVLGLCLLLNLEILSAQTETEVYLFDCEITADSLVLTNGSNISNNPGYDNQPHFYDSNTLIFSSQRDGQTDIKAYDIGNNHYRWISHTPQGGEYSPLRIPENDTLSAIRLDTTGLQRLYLYDPKTGDNSLILPDEKIGYHHWLDPFTLIATVLVANRMDLYLFNLKSEEKTLIAEGVGRSLGFLNKESLFYTLIQNREVQIMKLSLIDVSSSLLATIANTQDFIVVAENQMITWLNGIFLLYDIDNKKWRPYGQIPHESYKVTRMAISPDKIKMALVINNE